MQLTRNDIVEQLKEILLVADERNKAIIDTVTEDSKLMTDIGLTFTEEQLRAGVLLRRGKKNYHKILLK